MEYLITSTKYSQYLPADDFSKLTFDLQLFAGEKTEEATPKRRQEAREKGQVAKSIEINSAIILLSAFYFFSLRGKYMVEELQDVLRYMFSNVAIGNFTVSNIHSLALTLIIAFLKIVMPIMLLICVIGLVVNYAQVGYMFNPALLMPDIKRVNPMSGLSRIFFSKTALVNLAKSLMKISIVGYFIYTFIEKQIYILPNFIGADVEYGIAFFGNLIIDLGYRVGFVMLIIAVFDYYYQWYSHNEGLKMSKQEIKDEFKQTEGNPQIKGKIRAKQREMAMRRMMQEVPKADVVVTNPTHFAVALQYQDGMPAPVVVAKGQDNMALKIRQVATDNNVTIVENRSLARALYQTVEIGSFIPLELYQAVAEVLAYVYKLKRRLA